MYEPRSEQDFDALINSMAALGSQVALAPNAQVLNGILHHLQIIYNLEKTKQQAIVKINQRLDLIERMLKSNDLWPNDWEELDSGF